MRPASAALQNYLNGRGPTAPVLFADLYAFRLIDGTILRYSGAQSALAPPANSFQGSDGFGNGASLNWSAGPTPVQFPLGPGFSRVRTTLKVGLDPDRCELDIYPHPPGSAAPDLIGNFSWQAAAAQRFFDGALVEIDRLFMQTASPPDYSLGSIVLHLGRVGELAIGRSKITMQIPDLLVLLTGQYPRRLFQAGCTWVFGDANCTFNRTSLAQTIAAGAGSTQSTIATTLAPNPSTLFDQGTIIGTSGKNSGAARTILQLTGGFVYLRQPFAYSIAAGDQFQLLPGCDHTIATCNGTFGNLAKFGGFPYVPPPEAAV